MGQDHIEIGAAIREAREARGLSQEQLGKIVGISQNSIQKIEAGETRRSRYLHDIQVFLSQTPPANGSGARSRRGYKGPLSASLSAGAEEARPESPLEAPLPIYGTSEGPGGEVNMTGIVIGTFKRPAQLAQAPDVYTLYMVGEAMVPRYRAGDLLLIHPHLHPRPDDGVVLRSKDGAVAHVREFVGSSPTEWVLRLYRPDGPSAAASFKAESTTFRKADWPRCDVIYGVFARH